MLYTVGPFILGILCIYLKVKRDVIRSKNSILPFLVVCNIDFVACLLFMRNVKHTFFNLQ